METSHTYTAVLLDDQTLYSIVEVSQKLNIPEALFYEMAEHGLFEFVTNENREPAITEQALHRALAACRIHRDLEVNLPGVVLALELLDELEELRQQIAILEHR